MRRWDDLLEQVRRWAADDADIPWLADVDVAVYETDSQIHLEWGCAQRAAAYATTLQRLTGPHRELCTRCAGTPPPAEVSATVQAWATVLEAAAQDTDSPAGAFSDVLALHGAADALPPVARHRALELLAHAEGRVAAASGDTARHRSRRAACCAGIGAPDALEVLTSEARDLLWDTWQANVRDGADPTAATARTFDAVRGLIERGDLHDDELEARHLMAPGSGCGLDEDDEWQWTAARDTVLGDVLEEWARRWATRWRRRRTLVGVTHTRIAGHDDHHDLIAAWPHKIHSYRHAQTVTAVVDAQVAAALVGPDHHVAHRRADWLTVATPPAPVRLDDAGETVAICAALVGDGVEPADAWEATWALAGQRG